MRLPAAAMSLILIAIIAGACGGGSSTKKPTSLPNSTAVSSPRAVTGSPKPGAYAAEPALPQLKFGLATGLFPIPGDDGFAYLLTKDGMVRRVSMNDDGATHDIVLDMSSRLITDPEEEEGLLGLAFAPDFATSRRIYLNYTAGPPREDTVSRFVMAASGATNVASEEILLQIDDPFSNHNGGGMEFGPDGMTNSVGMLVIFTIASFG